MPELRRNLPVASIGSSPLWSTNVYGRQNRLRALAWGPVILSAVILTESSIPASRTYFLRRQNRFLNCGWEVCRSIWYGRQYS